VKSWKLLSPRLIKKSIQFAIVIIRLTEAKHYDRPGGVLPKVGGEAVSDQK